MESDNKIDPYEAIIKMKWAPESGEIKMEPIPAGTKVPIIQRAVIITDTSGRLIIRRPEDSQIVSNLINHAWELWVVPEIKRRREAKIQILLPLKKFSVIFSKEDGRALDVKFNDEFGLDGRLIIRRGFKINKGDDITFDQIADVLQINPPSKDGKPVAFFIFCLVGRQISVYFDFRPNDPRFKKDNWKDEERWLAEGYVDSILANQFGHLILIIPKLSIKEVPFTIGVKSEKMKALCDAVEMGIENEELDKKLSNVITQGEIEPLIDNWISLDLFGERANILKEVIQSFNNGVYGGVILLLMSQVEGIITEELILHKKGLNENGKAKAWETRIDEFYVIIKKEEIGPLTLRILDGTIHFLKNSSLYSKFTWSSTNNCLINRHACLHGKDVTFNSCANAIRMILLFDALYWIFSAISFTRKEKSMNPKI